MVRNGTDMTEHPDDIIRALADPERLRIAGALAAGDAAAKALSETLELPLARVRRHLTRLAAAGVARLQPDHRTYRLDRETLRWAAEQVGPPPRGGGAPANALNADER
jgi:DNA-binding transcriptional ArsR family regulator